MTLPVPLTVRIGNRHVTSRVESLTFRKEQGGVKNIAFRFAKPVDRLSEFDTSLFQRVYIYDARSAATVAEGRISDPGRSVDESGQRWDLVCFGPAQHAYDIEEPVIYVTRDISTSVRQVNKMNRGATWNQSTDPSDSSDNAPEAVVLQMPEGTTTQPNDTITVRFEHLRECGQFLGRVSCKMKSGANDGGTYDGRLWTSVDGSGGSASYTLTSTTTAAQTVALANTADFTDGRNVVDFIMRYLGGAAAKAANDNKWFAVYDWTLRARLKDQDGSNIIGGSNYANDYVLAHEVVKDLLGRFLVEFNGATAAVDTSGTYQIDQLAYPDGAPLGQILDDLMALEPAFYWQAGPSDSSGLYSFAWKLLPTTVRYECTLDAGGSFPVSSQELANKANVRWRDKRGRVRFTQRTAAAAGVSDLYVGPSGAARTRVLDVADEVGSTAGAVRVADNYLAAHATPANAGTLNLSAPIRDLTTNRWVRPHEVEPGELIRVRGVESYSDSLNASSSDGATVFRIWSLTYTSDSDSALLELDTYSRRTANALARLGGKRNRKR